MKFLKLEKAAVQSDLATLIHAVEDPKATRRSKRRAVGHLAKSSSPDATKALAQVLRSQQDQGLRSLAAAALKGNDSPEAQDALIQALKSDSKPVQVEAAISLRGRSSSESLRALTVALGSPHSSVRLQAFLAIATVDSEVATEAVRSALDCDDASIRRRAMRELAERRDVASIDRIKELAQNESIANRATASDVLSSLENAEVD